MTLDDINLMRCTTLAYVGDSVFTLYVRAHFSADLTIPAHTLMSKCSRIVSAVMQAKIHDALLPELTDDENALMNRCRNAHLSNRAKNATMIEYKKATALEGLLGAHYLLGDKARLEELLKRCLELINE